jgi:hypothetical protein
MRPALLFTLGSTTFRRQSRSHQHVLLGQKRGYEMRRLSDSTFGLTLLGFQVVLLVWARQARADFVFGEPTEVPNANSVSCDASPAISTDGLELYFTSNRPHGASVAYFDLWVATRATIDDEWGLPVKLGPAINSSAFDCDPSLSADGLELYFNGALPSFSLAGAPQRSGGHGDSDLWMSKRATKDDPWGAAANLGPVLNTSYFEGDASLTADGLQMFFGSNRPGGYGDVDLYVTTRATTADPWRTPANLGPAVNTTAWDDDAQISSDGLTLIFSSWAHGGYGGADLYMTTRTSTTAPWASPISLGSILDTPEEESDPSLASDGSMLYFGRGQYADLSSWNLLQVPIVPLTDFNGDGIVDGSEVLTMAESWGESDSLCDIGPMPWGNGIVDVEDLRVLARYIGAPIDDPTLIAHWAFDEAEGTTAHDSARAGDGIAYGSPVWEPDAGQVNGALRCDGIDDHVSTPFVLDPSNGPFSVLAWIKGGAPGQTIVSQIEGAKWICTAPTNGCLMTELKGAGRGGCTLGSEAAVADGSWHRIGLVWDGSNRRLYVDDALVAEDTQQPLAACYGGLHIGAGKGLEPGTFWTGLIDDVRIYNRTVRP